MSERGQQFIMNTCTSIGVCVVERQERVLRVVHEYQLLAEWAMER
jgi:hypothetical protein